MSKIFSKICILDFRHDMLLTRQPMNSSLNTAKIWILQEALFQLNILKQSNWLRIRIQKFSAQTDHTGLGQLLVIRKQLSHLILKYFLGKHNFLTFFIHLDDYCERGDAWKTWENMVFLDANMADSDFSGEFSWVDFQGRWGNTKKKAIKLLKN